MQSRKVFHYPKVIEQISLDAICYSHSTFFILKQDRTHQIVVITELQFLLILSNKYMVQYKGHWFGDVDCLYIKMEYCSSSLQDMIDRKSKFDTQQVNINPNGKHLLDYFITCEIMRDIASGLMYLHSYSPTKPPIIHRDLHPGNILVSTRRKKHQMKLCDFGLSTYESSSTTGGNNNYACPYYMAPELNGKQFHNCKADIYSAGKIAEQLFILDSSR